MQTCQTDCITCYDCRKEYFNQREHIITKYSAHVITTACAKLSKPFLVQILWNNLCL